MVQAINNVTRKVPAWPIYVLGFIPAAWWLYLALTNRFGAEPAIRLEHELGELALQLLILSLLITPLRDWFKLNLIKYRRAIGLMAFYYILLHLAVYLLLDQQVQWVGWDSVIKDITKRPYIIVGVVSLVVLVPLALTSNNWAIRKLGPIKWHWIHRLTYAAIVGGAAHYVMLQKVWEVEPLIYFFIATALVLYRVDFKGLVGVWCPRSS